MKITIETPYTGILKRYPRLTAHLICKSLGYFTPAAAAEAIKCHKLGMPYWCEWYAWMARPATRERMLAVGQKVLAEAFRGRRYHRGFMADYASARRLVEAELAGRGPVFMSW